MKLPRKLAHLVAVSVLIGGGVVGVVAATAAPAHALECYDGWLRSNANGRYVSTELGQTGSRDAMLRARATSYGPWERFTNSGP
jgi:hypothetical protein